METLSKEQCGDELARLNEILRDPRLPNPSNYTINPLNQYKNYALKYLRYADQNGFLTDKQLETARSLIQNYDRLKKANSILPALELIDALNSVKDTALPHSRDHSVQGSIANLSSNINKLKNRQYAPRSFLDVASNLLGVLKKKGTTVEDLERRLSGFYAAFAS